MFYFDRRVVIKSSSSAKCNNVLNMISTNKNLIKTYFKGVFAKIKRGYRLTSKNIWWRLLLILLLSVASIRRKLLKTTHTEERSVHTNSESCNILNDIFYFFFIYNALKRRFLYTLCLCHVEFCQNRELRHLAAN